ncbi:MAG TPA: hypothetical protein VHH73_07210, partial [Verrucomicrobiae bacterium]|nr:hypothetical protein [Verrucomicrobiae bacterium]
FSARARLFLANDGILGPANAGARYRSLAETLEAAIDGEAARWGWYRQTIHQYRTGPYEIYDRDDFWKPEVTRLLNEYFPRRTAVVVQQLKVAGLWVE